MIKANSLAQAKAKAVNYGENESVSYINENGETITWTLQQVVDVNSVLYDDFDAAENGVDLLLDIFGILQHINHLNLCFLLIRKTDFRGEHLPCVSCLVL